MAPAGGKEPEQPWPPKSPHEALLSTPKGRQRYREMLNRTSPSPSSRRSAPCHASPSSSSVGFGLAVKGGASDAEDDEDEETLQLKLQEIQAKLRLKKIQNARTKSDAGTSLVAASTDPLSPSEPDPRLAPKSPRRRNTIAQVPASPIQKLQAPQPQTSPSRVRLGIDKGLTAKDVSLKKVPSHRRFNSALTCRSGTGSLATSASSDAPKTSTFNERLAGLRNEEAFRKERQAKIQSVRSNAFGIGKDEMDSYKKDAVEIPNLPLAPPTFTRDQVLLGNGKPTGASLATSRTAPIGKPASDPGDVFSSSSDAAASSLAPTSEKGQLSYEPYSNFHLTRRILPHNVVTRHVSGKKPYSVKDLLRDVKGPDFSLPDIEKDVVVFAILAKKSEPRSHKTGMGKNGKADQDRGKYMVMTLADLEFELDLFLFSTGFERFWKLTEGTVIAILNPTVMPPPPGKRDTGHFSLVINSDEDTILELGIARDLGFCKSIKKDGNPCGSWVNKKRTEFCEYHTNEAVKKQKSTRVEMNSGGFGGAQNVSGKSGYRGGDWQQRKQTNKNFDRETQTHWFAARSMSASDLLDGKEISLENRKERAEFMKRKLEAKEKEREMMKKLGKVGSAAGREYMKLSGSKAASDSQVGAGGSCSQASGGGADLSLSSSSSSSIDLAKKKLELMRGTERTIHLSPVKRKRNGSSQSSVGGGSGTTASGRSSLAVGWGSDLKEKLLSMKEAGGEAKKARSPMRKKTRFVTDKGIREAGRESLGLDLCGPRVPVVEDDEDDELVIVG